MSLPGGEDDDEHVGGSRGNAGGRGSGYFSNEQLEALANLHSGLALSLIHISEPTRPY